MSDLATELRIIARDGGRLSQSDCALIAQAAEELEGAIHRALASDAALLEANARYLALQDRMRDASQQSAASVLDPALPWSMSTGWVRGETTA